MVKQGLTSVKNNLSEKLETHFNKTMKNASVPLLIDFVSYSKSLPVRCSDKKYMQLYKLNYYVRPKDLVHMAHSINNRISVNGRAELRYVSSPSATGKTSSILPAFLASKDMENNGTHYLYLPFNNNYERTFRAIRYPSSDESIAKKQGAAFIFECVKTLLERPDDCDEYYRPVEKSPKLSMEDVTEAMNKYLVEKLGEDCRIWFHIDQPYKICGRSYGSHELIENHEAFTYGAMQALVEIKGAKVITTCIEPPDFVPAISSSQICRYPIALPPIDINQVMSNVKELSINSSDFIGRNKQRMINYLKVKLALKLKEVGVIGLLHRRNSYCYGTELLEDFVKAKNGPKPLQALIDRCALKDTYYAYSTWLNDIAAGLLLGYRDGDIEIRK